MGSREALRLGLLAAVLVLSLALALGAAFAPALRRQFVFVPRERAVELAMGQIALRERTIRETTGRFELFSESDIARSKTLLELPWESFPLKDYFFDAAPLESGNIRLRALPRPESVSSLTVRARLYAAELTPDGAILHASWYPGGE